MSEMQFYVYESFILSSKDIPDTSYSREKNP